MSDRRIIQGQTVQIYRTDDDAAREAAGFLIDAAGEAIAERGHAVLGLATGKTPLPIYAEMLRRHKAGDWSWENVSTYNLDEYYPISPRDPNSYRTYMHRHLFGSVDLPANRAHVLDGSVPLAFVDESCALYDRWVEADGGIDCQLLGIGRNGHIGFNEPSDLPLEDFLRLRSRLTALHPATRADASAEFGNDPNRVPTHALTVGVAPILAARSIVVAAFGAAKARSVERALLGELTPQFPASVLRTAGDRVVWILDEAAAEGLS